MTEFNEEIMKKVEQKERNDKYFDRCLSTRTCPKCGAELTSNYCGGLFTLYGKTEYKCTSCGFTHIGG